MSLPEVMSDAQVAEFFGISKRTLQRRVSHPVSGEVDVNAAAPVTIGGRRIWLRDNVERVIGIKPKQQKDQHHE